METKQIKQHEEKYWYIPKFKIGLLYLLILILLINIGHGFVFVNEWKLHDISLIFSCSGEECNNIKLSSLGFIPILIFEYLLIIMFFITLIAFIKGGLDKLKSYDEVGLIFGLILGLILGLIFGLIFGLIYGLIVESISGLIVGSISGLIVGLIFGLIHGLISGFIIGLIIGLVKEFEGDDLK